jgi:uncharacterized protein (TIGR03437 family)
MTRLRLLAFGFPFLAAVAIQAAPAISSVANAASNLTFNAPVAQGSVFVIKGSGLGPASIVVSTTAFQTTNLSGTSVSISVNGTIVNAPMYYTSDTQVAALLPSNTPTGTGTFTVTYNNQPSNQLNHGIVASNFGILTIDSSGQGPAIVTYPADFSLVSAVKAANCGGPFTACGAANPGDLLIVWGTGVGPVSGNELGGAGLGQDMPNIPVTVWLGGVQAPVLYRGRSGCCIGEDSIGFTVPNNVPTGCAVPLVVQIGSGTNTISNTAVLPVATGSRNCTPTKSAYAPVAPGVLAGPVSFASVALAHVQNGGTPPVFQDAVGFQFAKILSYGPGTQPFFMSWLDSQPSGTCAAYGSQNGPGGPPITSVAALDAGSSFTVKGPNGTVPLKATTPSQNGRFDVAVNATGSFFVPGAYTVTGNGGADVGAFNATINFPAVPSLISPVNNGTATRTAGLTVSWTPGDPNQNVQMTVSSATDNTFSNVAEAICIAPAGAGTFTIPPYVLLALPAGNFAGFVFAPADTSVPFPATGIGAGFLTTHQDGTGFGLGAGTGGFSLK